MISSMPKWVGGWMKPNVRITEVVLISPGIRKIRLEGAIARMNFQVGYANVIRVSETEYRNYTVAWFDKKEGLLDIVLNVHGHGVGSQYMENLQPGDELYLSSPRGFKAYDPKVKQQLIFGDETSLGLSCAFLPVLEQNQHQFRFYFELDEANQEAPELLGLKNYTIFPKQQLFRNEAWIGGLPLMDDADWQSAHFVLTGNVKSVQTFRRVLKSKTSGKVLAQGYWLEGKKGL